jgi:hypothetical protein
MGKIIRRAITITITETWTIVWTTDDMVQPPATTIVPDQPKLQEEKDETILPAVTIGTATDAQPPDVSPKSGAGRQRKRTRRRPRAV